MSEMGTFRTTVGIESPLRRGAIVELPDVIVDTGAEATWIPRHKATNDDVVFAEPGDLTLLGARSLEGLNLRVDPRLKQLVSGGPIITAAA